LQVAELPEEDADPFALGVDLGVGGLESILGVEGALCQDASRCASVAAWVRRRWLPLASIAVVTSLLAAAF
jgi:hypothetical protein